MTRAGAGNWLGPTMRLAIKPSPLARHRIASACLNSACSIQCSRVPTRRRWARRAAASTDLDGMGFTTPLVLVGSSEVQTMARLTEECQQGEARQPMLAHIVAGEMRHGGGEMVGRGGLGDASLGRSKQRREASPAPRTAQIKPVEVGDLAVASVADDRRGEQARRV